MEFLNNPNQDNIKVVLNGGSDVLESAIVPFTFGLSEKIIDQNPTHVLIIDRTGGQAEREGLYKSQFNTTGCGKRYIIDLSAPGQFIEFFSPGNHNLLFIFYGKKWETADDLKKWKKTLLENEYHSNSLYERKIYTSDLTSDAAKNDIVGFCEKDVEIPQEFFSKRPAGFIWKWTNKWYRRSPADQCEFRKRALIAFSIQPIVMSIWFVIRFIWAFLSSVFVFGFKIIQFISGWQNKSYFCGMDMLWKWFFWQGDVSETLPSYKLVDSGYGTYGYKELSIGDKSYLLPISILGLGTFISALWALIHNAHTVGFSSSPVLMLGGFLIVQLWVIIGSGPLEKKFKQTPFFENRFWKTKDEYSKKESMKLSRFDVTMLCTLVLYILTFFTYVFIASGGASTCIHWIVGLIRGIFRHTTAHGVGNNYAAWIYLGLLLIFIFRKRTFPVIRKIFMFIGWCIYKLLASIDAAIGKWSEKKATQRKAHVAKSPKSTPRFRDVKQQWLFKSYNLDAMPTKVTSKNLPQAQTFQKRFVQRFRTTFWNTKAKVCKPYADD